MNKSTRWNDLTPNERRLVRLCKESLHPQHRVEMALDVATVPAHIFIGCWQRLDSSRASSVTAKTERQKWIARDRSGAMIIST